MQSRRFVMSFEGLNSFLAQLPDELQSCKMAGNKDVLSMNISYTGAKGVNVIRTTLWRHAANRIFQCTSAHFINFETKTFYIIWWLY